MFLSHPEPTIPINLLKNLQKLFCNYLTQEGIIRKNDPYLYGERIKAYFHKGARKMNGFLDYPNNEIGYGKLCVAASLYN